MNFGHARCSAIHIAFVQLRFREASLGRACLFIREVESRSMTDSGFRIDSEKKRGRPATRQLSCSRAAETIQMLPRSEKGTPA